MLLDEEKAKGLEDLLAVQTALASISARVSFMVMESISRRLLDPAAAADVRLEAVKAMVAFWNDVLDDPAKQSRLVEQYRSTQGAENGAVDEEELADQLLNQVMENDEDLESTDAEDLDDESLAGAQGRLAKTPGRNGAQEKAAPPAKPKAKRGEDEVGVLRRVPRKYWIILAVSTAALLLVWIARPDNPDADTLSKRAVALANLDDRVEAAMLLTSFPGEPATSHIERLVKESKDPEVVVRLIPMLVVRKLEGPTRDIMLDTLNHADTSVRAAAFEGLLRMTELTADEKASFIPDAPAATRDAAVRLLKDKYKTKPP